MKLPDLSNMMHVGQLRYIQVNFDSAAYRNPDSIVGTFLSFKQRLTCIVRGRLFMTRLRSSPFYHYVLARTKYYDEVFLDAVCASYSNIINIGCGSDTRAYRFAHILKQKGIAMLECDQSQAIIAKQKIAQKHFLTDHIRYIPLDLNETKWPDFENLLNEMSQKPVLVMMEGVSPYIRPETFEAFLSLLSNKLHEGSTLAYDFKIAGSVDSTGHSLDDFGQSEKVQQPFRLPADMKKVSSYHDAIGFNVKKMELSSDLSKRLLPESALLFDEDCLLLLSPCKQVVS